MASPRWLKWLVGLVMLLLAAAAIGTSILIADRQEALQRVARYNMSWLLSQAATETIRLVEAVSAVAVPGSKVDRDDVDLRVEIVMNRLQLLNDGEVGAFLRANPELTATVAALQAGLADAAALVDGLPKPEVARHLRGILEPLVPKLVQLAAASDQRSGEIVATDQRELSMLHWALTALTFGMMASVIVLLAVIGWVRGMLNLLTNETMPKLAADYVQVAHRSGTFLLDLISGILDFSQIEAGRMVLDEEVFDLRVLTEDVVAMLSSTARAKNIAIKLNLGNRLAPFYLADPIRLRQILINLLGNAIKFTEHGQVEIIASVIEQRSQHHVVRIDVQDSGVGVAADKLTQIFEPFTQADISSTRRYGGTGLGLTIARNLVDLMGGEMTVQSTVGVGSVFSFTVPLQLASGKNIQLKT